MDLRTRTIMLCAAFAIAITVSILLRSRKNRAHYLLSAFAGTMALWYLAQALFGFFQADIWYRFTAVLAVLLPQFALHLFEAIAPHPAGERSKLLRVAVVLGIPMLLLAVSEYQTHAVVRSMIFLYVFGLVAAGLAGLAFQGRRAPSRAVRERVRLLVLVGTFALFFSIGDFVWFIGAAIPPVGAVLSVVFLFALAESMQRERLIDLYEMVGRLVVSTALAFCLAGIFYVFVTYVGFDTMYLNAVLAAIAILVLFEPLRNKVEEQIHVVFFRQRHELERVIRDTEQRLVHILQLDEMGHTVIGALEESRRATSAALYLLDPDGRELSLRQSFGLGAEEHIEVATARPLLERLREAGSVVVDDFTYATWNVAPRAQSAAQREALLTAAKLVGPIVNSGVILGIRPGSGDVIGLLVVRDERVRDAFSSDEIVLFERLASMIGVVVENTRAYARMKERDRLAVLGQMAAGLAHEIKNTLGSIKGAAELLVDAANDGDGPASTQDFLDIIIEEVDRLDRVVGSVLDYARPRKGNPAPVDVNAVVKRTVQILGPSSNDRTRLETDLGTDLAPVRIDAEQLRQVIMNLVQNAVQAMGERGGVATLSTRMRDGDRRSLGRGPTVSSWVEIVIRDTGPGISSETLNNLFVPFFSTKAQGTGLGLAISQRIAQEAGGVIEVTSQEGAGSAFLVVLPAYVNREPRSSTPLPRRVEESNPDGA
jgi:two-component system sensor histidine kinase HydH